MQLREIAHSRTGDKGNTVNISVIAYRTEDYPLLERYVTAERVNAHFQGIVQGNVIRYALPRIGALNFVLERALDGGVTRSPALDAHGKSLSSALLSLELPEFLIREGVERDAAPTGLSSSKPSASEP